MAGGHASFVSALFVILCAFLCNLTLCNSFIDNCCFCRQADEVIFLPRTLFSTKEGQSILPVFPRGRHQNLGKFRRLRFLAGRISYYSNATCVFNVAEYRILRSGDVEINPGYENELSEASKQPRNLKFPRRVCEKSVRNNQKGILCDNCNMWFHCQCIGINAMEYQALASSDDEWICYLCALPCFSDSFFETATTNEITQRCENFYVNSETADDVTYDLPNGAWLFHLNCRNIISHIDELRLIFKENLPYFIAVSETWLDASIVDSEISIPGYTVQRRDRGQNRRGGGVALFVLDGLKYSRRKDLEDKYEVVWIQVQLRKTKFLVSCVYRAPDESLEVFDYLDDVMRYTTCGNFEVIILGDMNCNFLDSNQRQNARLVEFLAANELTQMVTEPTRVTNNSSSLLDVLITSRPDQFKDVGFLDITLSDHYPIYGVMNMLGT